MIKIVTIVLFFSFLQISCSEDMSKGMFGSDTEKENASENDNEKDVTDKLNFLINNYNGMSTDSYNAYDYYVKAFGDNPEKFQNITWYSTRQIHQHEIDGLKELTSAMEINVFSELDPLILEYQARAKVMADIVNEAYTYYDMKDFENDEYAKAKEMHKPLLNAFFNFFDIDDLLRHKTDSIQDIREIAYIEELKENGETLNYLISKSLNVSSKMLKISQSSEYNKLNSEELIKASIEVRFLYDELSKFKKENTEEYESVTTISFYYSALEDFTKSAQGLSSRVKNKKPFSRGEKMNLNNKGSGWMVNDSVPKLLYDYNKLVDSYNRMMKF